MLVNSFAYFLLLMTSLVVDSEIVSQPPVPPGIWPLLNGYSHAVNHDNVHVMNNGDCIYAVYAALLGKIKSL